MSPLSPTCCLWSVRGARRMKCNTTHNQHLPSLPESHLKVVLNVTRMPPLTAHFQLVCVCTQSRCVCVTHLP